MVLYHKLRHSLPVKVVYFVQNHIDTLYQVTSFLSLTGIQLSVEFNNRTTTLRKGSHNPIIHQLKYSVLQDNHGHVIRLDALFGQRRQISIDSLECSLEGVATLIVHADTDENLYSATAKPLSLPHFAQVVEEPILSREVGDGGFLGGVLLDNLFAVVSVYSVFEFGEGSPTVSYDGAFVEPRAGVDGEGGEGDFHPPGRLHVN